MESYRSRQILHRLLDEEVTSPTPSADRLVAWCARSLPVTGAAVLLMAGMGGLASLRRRKKAA